MKFDAVASSEIKSTHSLLTANFTRRRRISHCKAIFHPPARVDLVENDRFLSESVVFRQGHKDLNPEPTVLETAALPIELYPYIKKAKSLVVDGGPSGIRTRDYPVMSRRL